jgi:hypothetical protein
LHLRRISAAGVYTGALVRPPCKPRILRCATCHPYAAVTPGLLPLLRTSAFNGVVRAHGVRACVHTACMRAHGLHGEYVHTACERACTRHACVRIYGMHAYTRRAWCVRAHGMHACTRCVVRAHSVRAHCVCACMHAHVHTAHGMRARARYACVCPSVSPSVSVSHSVCHTVCLTNCTQRACVHTAPSPWFAGLRRSLQGCGRRPSISDQLCWGLHRGPSRAPV